MPHTCALPKAKRRWSIYEIPCWPAEIAGSLSRARLGSTHCCKPSSAPAVDPHMENHQCMCVDYWILGNKHSESSHTKTLHSLYKKLPKSGRVDYTPKKHLRNLGSPGKVSKLWVCGGQETSSWAAVYFGILVPKTAGVVDLRLMEFQIKFADML